MEKLSITTRDDKLAKTLMTIIKGELKNWGYETTDLVVAEDAWGKGILEMDVRREGES